MKNFYVAIIRAVAWLYLSLFIHNAFGHDLEDASSFKWAPKRLDYMPGDHAPKVPPGIILPQYVFGLHNRWAIGQDIHICFFGGTDELRKRIIGVAKQWFDHANLHLVAGEQSGKTCDANDHSEIRVGFSEPGYWSYVGTDGLNPYLLNNNLTSMNLQGFDTAPPEEPRFSGIVLHEFGHALGFEHEHQSPAGGCDKEYDWAKLYSYYQRTYGWNQQMVDQNLRELSADRSAYAWSQFDPLSIMIYGSDPQFLIHGKDSPCYVHDNNSLSALDVRGAETTYPVGNPVPMLQSRIIALQKATSTLSPGPLKSALVNQIELHKTQMEKLSLSR